MSTKLVLKRTSAKKDRRNRWCQNGRSRKSCTHCFCGRMHARQKAALFCTKKRILVFSKLIIFEKVESLTSKLIFYYTVLGPFYRSRVFMCLNLGMSFNCMHFACFLFLWIYTENDFWHAWSKSPYVAQKICLLVKLRNQSNIAQKAFAVYQKRSYRVFTIGKSWEFCQHISRSGKSRERCVLILNKNKKQFGKNNVLYHVETNAIGADEY